MTAESTTLKLSAIISADIKEYSRMTSVEVEP